MKNQIIANFEAKMTPKTKIHPSFRPGDSIKVHYKIEEAAKKEGKDAKKDKKATHEKRFRVQIFEGVCLRFKKGTQSSSFTVRKVGANNVGVERIFPYNSPLIDKIEIVNGGQVRRSRLYYLRDLKGKAARIRTRRLPTGSSFATVNIEAAVAAPIEAAAE